MWFSHHSTIIWNRIIHKYTHNADEEKRGTYLSRRNWPRNHHLCSGETIRNWIYWIKKNIKLKTITRNSNWRGLKFTLKKKVPGSREVRWIMGEWDGWSQTQYLGHAVISTYENETDNGEWRNPKHERDRNRRRSLSIYLYIYK